MQFKSLPEPVTMVDDEIEFVGMNYSLGEHHAGTTNAHSSIMPAVSQNYVVFAPDQFVRHIPMFVWLKIMLPLMGADVLGHSASICRFFRQLHVDFAKQGVLHVSPTYNLSRCLHYIATLCAGQLEPFVNENTFTINICEGLHSLDRYDDGWPDSDILQMQLIGHGQVSIETPVFFFQHIKLILRNLQFKRGFYLSRMNIDYHVTAYGCTFSNTNGNGATLRSGAALKAFDCTFENCSENGLCLIGGRSVENNFYFLPGDTLLQEDAVPNSMTLAVTSFFAYNCKFNHNGQNGIELETLTNFYLDGKDCEMAHNTLKGMHSKERRGNYGGLIRLGTAVPLDFSKLNGDHDCYTTNPIMVIRDTKTVNVEEEEFMSAVYSGEEA